MSPWQAKTFHVARDEISLREGITRGGLGVYLETQELGAKPFYVIVHLGSGHSVLLLAPHVQESQAIAIAEEFLASIDFSAFSGLDPGNIEPEWKRKCQEVFDANHASVHEVYYGSEPREQDQELARAIASEQEG